MKKRATRLFAAVLALTAFLSTCLTGCEKKPVPSISVTPTGEGVITVECGQEYTDPGAEAAYTLQEQTGPVEVVTTGSVDIARTGSYYIKYTAQHEGVTATAYRRVDVVDTVAPVISLTGEADATSGFGWEYQEQGFTATDNYDGDITHRVLRRQDDEKVYYTVTDRSGNTATLERWIGYADNEAPVLTLTEGADYNHPAGVAYADPGYSAIDNRDGDISSHISTSGWVDIRTPGDYALTYTVTDRSGNTATAYRTVHVVPQTPPEVVTPEGKVIYLTFDDGPGPYTEQLLDLLKRYDVKATFFVVNNSFSHLYNRIVEEGHAIGIHTNTHVFKQIYASDEAFLDDLFSLQATIYQRTGVLTTLMRFPGGSSNTNTRKYSKGIMTRLTQKVVELGFQYFDWNVDSDDAGKARSADTVFHNVVSGALDKQTSIVLQHDIKGYSVEAVERILNWGLRSGYTFLPLTPNSPGFRHTVQN